MSYIELNNKSFNAFVTAVLRNKTAEQGASFFIETVIEEEEIELPYRFDAISIKKTENKTIIAVIDYIYNLKKTPFDRFLTQIKSIKSRLPDGVIIPIVITNSNISDYMNFYYRGDYNVRIIDRQIINEWIEQYPIDYLNAINVDSNYVGEYSNKLTLKDFEDKSNSNKKILRHIFQVKDNFALVLGAGISVDPGAQTWKDMMNEMFNLVKAKSLLDNRTKVCEKVGTTELISAQLCKDIYNDDRAFFWDLHNSIYENRKPINKSFSINSIAELVGRSIKKRNFRIMTYNFDEYLETYLFNEGIRYNTLFDSECELNQYVSIYHVHGFLPQSSAKSNLEKRCMDSIYLTEESYNKLYNHPYSWQIATQLSFFRENICLFIGCGLTDPNIRRLLEIAHNKNKSHYAILKKDSNSKKDLAVITKHFSRMGVEIIWIDDFKEIKDILDMLH